MSTVLAVMLSVGHLIPLHCRAVMLSCENNGDGDSPKFLVTCGEVANLNCLRVALRRRIYAVD